MIVGESVSRKCEQQLWTWREWFDLSFVLLYSNIWLEETSKLKTHAQNARTASYGGVGATTAKRTAIAGFTVHARLYKLGKERRLVRTHYYLRPFMVYCGNVDW